jgi:hypothetical protein
VQGRPRVIRTFCCVDRGSKGGGDEGVVWVSKPNSCWSFGTVFIKNSLLLLLLLLLEGGGGDNVAG